MPRFWVSSIFPNEIPLHKEGCVLTCQVDVLRRDERGGRAAFTQWSECRYPSDSRPASLRFTEKSGAFPYGPAALDRWLY